MCGICGVLNFDASDPVDRAVVEQMNERIRHRGPDDDGFFVSGNVGLAMRRLSIIDLRTGHQPIGNEDGTVRIVFNGEIYNYRELRSELQSRGHRFATQSDTETIVHLYEEHGRRCVERLRGMFAFAIWDDRRRRLLLARDRLGIKPLYLRHSAGRLLFGSEIKTLLAHPEVTAELEPRCLPEYLAFGYLTGDQTLFRGIEKLPPGHTLEVDSDGRLDIQRYWDLRDAPPGEGRSEKYYVANYRERLEGAVSSHLMSDVPLGVFLSGGLDSSTIAALTQKMVGDPVETFSVGYDTPESELGYAQEVAQHLGTVHHEVKIGSREFFDALPSMVWHEDEPLVWPSSVALYFVARLAKERVTVVLTGEGSDETLGGYTRYAWSVWNTWLDRIYRRVAPAGLRRLTRDRIGRSGWLKADVRRRLQHSFLGRDLSDWPAWYFEDFYVAFSEAQQASLLREDLRPSPGAAIENSLACWDRSSGDPLKRLLYTDISSYLIELLMKQDNMSMAASVESRVPFLDHELVEFASSIPTSYNVRGLAGKRILKKAVGDLLPDSIIHRRKMGFPTPLRAWLRGKDLDDVESLVLSPRGLERELFREAPLRQLFSEHRSLHRDNTDRIWRLLNLELWCRIFLDGDAVRPAETGGPVVADSPDRPGRWPDVQVLDRTAVLVVRHSGRRTRRGWDPLMTKSTWCRAMAACALFATVPFAYRDAGARAGWAEQLPDERPILEVGEARLDPPTLTALGVQLLMEGDSNKNASVAMRFRERGASAWRPAQPLHRVWPPLVVGLDVPWQFSGSIFDLLPATQYEIELRAVDPDGAVDERILLTGTTRRVPPTDPENPRLRPVSDAATLRAALASARPGDVILLDEGVYQGSFSIFVSGTFEDPIVIRGRRRAGVILDGNNCRRCGVVNIHGSYVHLEQVTIQSAGHAIDYPVTGVTGNVVRRVYTRDTRRGILSRAGQRDSYICDNVLEGRLQWPHTWFDDRGAHGDDDGIAVNGSGHVVCHNEISGFGDALKIRGRGARGIDFYGNEILFSYDNGIELDGSAGNTRALRNRFTNSLLPLSFQPIYGGPAYAIRNIAVNVGAAQFKFHGLATNPPQEPSGMILWHNSFVSVGHAVFLNTGATSHLFMLQNNIFVGPSRPTGGRTVSWAGPINTAVIDYNGYYPDGDFVWQFARRGRVFYSSFADMQSEGMEPNGVLLGERAFASGLSAQDDYRRGMQPQDLTLSTDSAAVDRAVLLANINDDFSGLGPDLGALELGCRAPIFGVRPEGVDESNHRHSCSGPVATRQRR